MKIAQIEQCQYVLESVLDGAHETTHEQPIRLFKDLGYVGYNPKQVTIMAPIKKPPKRALTPFEKWFNRTISHLRVSVEHAIAGIKRCRIIKERARCATSKRDQHLLLATGLHNFRVTSSRRAYKFRTNPKHL